ncbi:flavin reductase family protein [Rhodococcus sp. NPDC003348]
MNPLPIADRFKEAFRHHPAGVAVVTADPGDGPVGLTASSVISVSADPAILVLSLSGHASATPHLLRADSLVVHMLGADQLTLAKTFATGGIDRFADRDRWHRLGTGEPVLRGVPAWLRGRITSRMQAGEATVVVLEITDIGLPDSEVSTLRPLVYHNRCWHTLGRETSLA